MLAALRAAGARRVLDLGCGGGALLRDLLADPQFTEIVGVDVSARRAGGRGPRGCGSTGCPSGSGSGSRCASRR